MSKHSNPIHTGLVRRVFQPALRGRRIDPDDPARGRLSLSDLRVVAAGSVGHASRLQEHAALEDLSSIGNRLNVRLAVLTIALYRALVDFGVPPGHAADLTADVGWRVYRAGAQPVVLWARVRSGDPLGRVAAAIRLLLRFPFVANGRPGYEVVVVERADSIDTTWTWCPPLAFVRRVGTADGDHGALEAFRRSWCSYDWALNDVLAGGRGAYRRPHTMSEGADRCDMTWAVAGTGDETPVDPPTGIRRWAGNRPSTASHPGGTS